jgi:nitroreductase
MEFRHLVESRVSVRQFTAEPVPLSDLREMVRLAGLAPSPNNSQPWQFIAVTRPSLLQEMGAVVHAKVRAILPDEGSDAALHARQRVDWYSTFFIDAPLVVGVVLLPYKSVVEAALEGSRVTASQINAMRGQPDLQSLGAAVEHFLLAATNLGFGSCWLSGPLLAREALERLMAIEPPGRLAAMIALGKAATSTPAPRERKPVDEILRVID